MPLCRSDIDGQAGDIGYFSSAHWLIGSLAHWLIGSLAHWLIGSLAHWLIAQKAMFPQIAGLSGKRPRFSTAYQMSIYCTGFFVPVMGRADALK
ncbi:hypothetical protein CAP48_09785 [Advenella sp. S44]|nr:hypothetical protein CAP48_09785 [Advenella sp. S44]